MAEPLIVDPSEVHSITVDPSQVSLAKPPEQPGMVSRAVTATGLPAAWAALTKGFTSENPDPGIIVHNAVQMVKAGLGDPGAHTTQMMDRAAHGDFLAAGGHAVASVPFVGPMIDKLATHLENGEWPEAGGTALALFGPKALHEAAPMVAPVVKAATETASKAVTPAVDFVKGAAPELPVVKQVVTGPIRAGIAQVQKAAAERAAAAAAQQPSYTPATVAGKPGVTEVPAGAVAPVEYGAGAGHFGEQQPPPVAPVAPPPRVPIWARNEEPAPLGSVLNVEPSAAELAKSRQLYQAMRNRNVQSTIDKIKALGAQETGTIAEESPVSKPANPQLSQQLGELLDRLRKLQPEEPETPPASLEDQLAESVRQVKARKGKQ